MGYSLAQAVTFARLARERRRVEIGMEMSAVRIAVNCSAAEFTKAIKDFN